MDSFDKKISANEKTNRPDRVIPAIEFRDVHLSFDDKKVTWYFPKAQAVSEKQENF